MLPIDICQFIVTIRPSIESLLRRLEQTQVCTNAVCYESVDDLAPMVVAETNGSLGVPLVTILATGLWLLALLTKPPLMSTHKTRERDMTANNDPDTL